MIKILINDIDVSSLISSVSWSGDKDSIARSIEFDIIYALHDYYIPKMYPNIGDNVVFYDNDKELFRGKVFYNERLSNQGTIRITCYDDAIRLSKSKGTFNFKNKTAEEITKAVCNEIGLQVGSLAYTGIKQKMLCQGRGMYDIIRESYDGASQQNKKRYRMQMDSGKLYIYEYGDKVLDYVLNADTNIISSSYSENAEQVINKVKIYDENDKYLDTISNNDLINLLGVMQDVYTKEKDKQARAVATSMLKGIEKTVDVEVLGHNSCITGQAIKVIDPVTNLTGIFYINSDTHTWKNGQYITTMTLEFKE